MYCFTETWLDPSIPDSTVLLPVGTLNRADRLFDLVGKSKKGGVFYDKPKRWCNDASVLSTLCTSRIETLTIKCRPYYMPREVSSLVLVAVYLPPQAHAPTAIGVLADHVISVENSFPDSHVLVLGDFNRTTVHWNRSPQSINSK